MSKPSVVLIFLLLFSAVFIEASAQTTSILPTDTFAIPTLNSQIHFATEVDYTSASLENNTWFFTGLHASGKAGYPLSGHLHISAKNCTVFITYLQAWTQPEIGGVGLQWIKYNVINGSGTQTLDTNDLFPNSVKWTNWTVKINGEVKEIGTSWNLSDSKLLTISTQKPSLVEISVIHEAVGSEAAPLPKPEPALYNFTSADYFQIPASNGTINFETAGSFDKASLDSDTWNFVNLTLSSYTINAGIFAPNVTGRDVLPYILQCHNPANLGISLQNCAVTITGISPLTCHSISPELNYTIQGNGSQTFTFPFRLASFNWTVYIDGVPKLNNDGWFQTSDYQLKITNATSNVSVIGEAIPVAFPPIVYGTPIIVLAFAGTTVLLTIVIVILGCRVHRVPSWQARASSCQTTKQYVEKLISN
jgi:hypothetical protein